MSDESRRARSESSGERGRPRPGERGGAQSRGRSDQRGQRAGGGGTRGRRTEAGPGQRPRAEQRQRLEEAPEIPPGVSGAELDRSVSAQLRGLPERLAARVARRLAAAGALIDDDPEAAYRHALAARAEASRLAVVREAVGETAYAAGHYAEALAELRAAKRMNGATAYLPMMADCHRALGNPAEALKLARSPSVRGFQPEAKAEMTIVEAGARRDLGQVEAALRTLEQAPLSSRTRAPWVVRLRYAYADALEEAGRLTEALAWFHRTHAIDGDEITDAAARADALEARLGQ